MYVHMPLLSIHRYSLNCKLEQLLVGGMLSRLIQLNLETPC